MGMTAPAAQTAATQWLERTLDDSAVRRLIVPQAFLAIDAVLTLYLNVVPGLVVYPNVIARHVAEELPFMATENLMMAAVQKGADRQEVHEVIRRHAHAAGARIKGEGAANDLMDRLRLDGAFAGIDLDSVMDPRKFVGRSPEQVEAFVTECVEPVRRKYPGALGQTRDVHV